jgi:beta-lactamase class A
MSRFNRRSFLLCGGGAVLGSCTALNERTGAMFHLTDVETQLGGRLGLAALNTANGTRLYYRADERFAMCSSYKWLLAAAVLAQVDRNEVSLEQRISYSAADLVDFSPVTRAHVDEGVLPIAELCAAMIEVSDNTAANLLLKLIGGPQSLTAYIRGIGDPITRLDRNEPDLNTNIAGDERDTTTPNAMVRTMNQFLLDDALSADSRQRLIDWLKHSRTGMERLRAGLPSDWIEGDKTGTGMNGAAVDTAIVWPPGRPPILIASYLSESTAPAAALNAAHARIGRIVADAFPLAVPRRPFAFSGL